MSISFATDDTCKVILLGNGSVGKSSIIARFVDDGFSKVYKQTVGLDFFQKVINLRGDKRLHLQVIDSYSSTIIGAWFGMLAQGSRAWVQGMQVQMG